MDALSDVLNSIRLEGAFYLNAEFTAPWCIRGECAVASVRQHLAGAEHVVFFHFLVEGRCKVRLDDHGGMLEAKAGDLILIARDDRHLLGSDLQMMPLDAGKLVVAEAASDDNFVHLRHGGGGETTRFVCGYLACSRSVCRPLLDALPRLLCISIGEGPASTLLRELLRVGVRESSAARPGAESMLAKLSELLFVEAMRHHVANVPPDAQGWLAGVRDPHVGRALALLHAAPARAWTVDELAREVALSRSALAERFTTLIGEPPMQYLTRWRLALAAQALRSGRDSVARVAERSGYESEAAFCRAFKREFGTPPAAWRRAGQHAGAVAS
ncbi:AraC family transcriptional regulator [Solimonas terrae]|uniref:AraC family transcriptional regulator n=1 Tax=Solimonas terrae TaxID=1396819 RepID=A0A6M2BQC1_9GAMM|nr:AraC family transcriptional regulator [Solimonas terrae]NGY04648.1 AraC family transcriptional regulator [Solimonas terrae]